mgnify:CR=1 FL=1
MQVVRDHFPMYTRHKDMVYLDNASSTLTPNVVVDAMNGYYEQYRANVHRGLYESSTKATKQYENARKTIADYLNASPEEIIFTSGATQGLNMLAQSLGKTILKTQNVVLTRLEHHANLVPWQQAAKQYGFELRFIELTNDGYIDVESAKKVIDSETAVVSFCATSNAIGTEAPIKELVELAKANNALTIIDAAQRMSHGPVDVGAMDCDFLVLSGHKMYGPTGIGILFGKKVHLESLEPSIVGGDMVDTVTYTDATWAASPHKFEAGTPNIAGAIGLATAFVYLAHLRWAELEAHEDDLKKYAMQKLQKEVTIVGPQLSQHRSGVISFTIAGAHPHDIADILGAHGVCVRAGHHCAMPLMNHLNISGTTRMSLGIYNTRADIDKLVAGIRLVKETLKLV